VKTGIAGRISSGTLYVFLGILAFLSVMPFYITMINATHTDVSIVSNLNLLPGNNLQRNFQHVSRSMNILRGFANSLTVSIPSVVLSLYFGAMTAYGFAKYRFRYSNALFFFVIMTLMVPMQLGLVGYFLLHSRLGLLDTYIPLILPWIAHPPTVFFMKMYIDSAIPDELIEAGRIDGSTEFGTFNRLILPLLTPALATLAIFNFVGSWNNFIMPLTILFSRDRFTLPLLVAMLRGVYADNYGAIYLGVAMSILPIIVVYAFVSRRIIGGLIVGAVKG
jgi:multiple sugar transport system permease protein